MYIKNTAQVILPPVQNTLTICKPIIFLVIYKIISGKPS